MDFEIVDKLADLRDAAARWLDENADPEWAEEQARTGDFHTPELQRRLARDGWLGAGWPREYGGTDNSPQLATAIYQEMARRGFHLDGWGSTRLVCQTLLRVGTEDQKQRYVRGMIDGAVLIALGYTEPDSGSDAAAAKCRSVRDGEEWVIDGQKMFTSTAQLSTHVFMLTRSDFDVPKHEGLTMFMVGLDAPGVEIQPMYTVGGQRTNATFYSDVRVPDADRVGDVGEGWSVMKVALGFEHGARRPPTSPTLLEGVASWARETTRPDGSRVFDDQSVQERLARIAIDEEIAKLLSLRVAWIVEHAGMPGAEGSMAKLFGAEARQRQHATLQEIVGPEAVLQHFSGDAPLDGAVDSAFRYGIVDTIYGGSSEIMREIVAQRHLGLPRNRPRD
jgi:alkylation response protein AidB-like acyl-CoA dehydrogenase